MDMPAEDSPLAARPVRGRGAALRHRLLPLVFVALGHVRLAAVWLAVLVDPHRAASLLPLEVVRGNGRGLVGLDFVLDGFGQEIVRVGLLPVEIARRVRLVDGVAKAVLFAVSGGLLRRLKVEVVELGRGVPVGLPPHQVVVPAVCTAENTAAAATANNRKTRA